MFLSTSALFKITKAEKWHVEGETLQTNLPVKPVASDFFSNFKSNS